MSLATGSVKYAKRGPGMLYWVARALVRAALKVTFRRIQVQGLQLVPEQGPLLVVANHFNGAVDPALIGVSIRRPLRLTAKSTLQNMPLLDAVFRAFGVIAIHRQKDQAEGADPARNGVSLDAIVDGLCAGHALAFFPEGISHDGPGLLRFKLGAAHVALTAAARQPDRPVWLLPCGIGYSAKHRLRGEAELHFGAPIDASAWRREHPTASAGDLTALLRQRVEGLLSQPLPATAAKRAWARTAALPLGLPALVCLGPALLASAWATRRLSPDRHSDPSWQVFSLAAFMPLSAAATLGSLWLANGWPTAVAAAVILPLAWPALWLGLDGLRAAQPHVMSSHPVGASPGARRRQTAESEHEPRP